jgi:hypothetical protein
MPILRHALIYLAAIFALGFVLGTVRTLWLAPAVGHLAAVALELPVMLGASWWLARRMAARRPLPSRGAALQAGGIAFALLMALELALGMTLFGQSAGQWLAALTTPSGALGLTGQALFALMPALVWKR